MDIEVLWGVFYLVYTVVIVLPALLYSLFAYFRDWINKGRDTPRTKKSETNYILLGLGYLLIFIGRELNWNPILVAVCLLLYVLAVLSISLWLPLSAAALISLRTQAATNPRTLGLRIIFGSLAVLVVLVGAGDAIGEVLEGFAYDFFVARWPHVIVALLGLWGTYIYVRGRSQ